jgi:hypothetical protein
MHTGMCRGECLYYLQYAWALSPLDFLWCQQFFWQFLWHSGEYSLFLAATYFWLMKQASQGTNGILNFRSMHILNDENPLPRHQNQFSFHSSLFIIPPVGRRDLSYWPCATLYPQTLALTSPTSGSRSVDIVHSQTEATEFSFFIYYKL